MPGQFRLLLLDLDGTVFDSSHSRITPRTLAAIQAALARGVAVAPSTGRPLSGLPEAFLRIPGVEYALTSNGAAVWKLAGRQKLVYRPIETQYLLTALRLMEGYDCMVDVYLDGGVYTSAASLEKAQRLVPPSLLPYVRATRTVCPGLGRRIAKEALKAEKVTMFFADEAQRLHAAARARDCGLFEVVSSVPRNLELNARGVHKGEGLRALAAWLGLAPEQVMACGDGGNDVEMLEAAGLGVAMGNAPEEVKRRADVATASNDEDGVALAIERYIL